jgi:hypothetical protein
MIDQYPPANGVLTSLIWRKTAAGGETSLSGYDNASQALSYTPGQEQVYLNGILLVRGSDYTATNGTSITGLAALAADDFVQINCYNNFSVATLPTSGLTGTIANNQLQNSSITINGSAVSLGGSTTIAGGSAQDSEPTSPTEGQLWLDTNGTLATTAFTEKSTLTTTGDIYYASAADTPARLGIGSAGNILTVSGGVPAWSAPSSGSMTQLATGSFSGTNLQLASISTAYKDLRLVIQDWYMATDNSLFVQLNNVTTTSYQNIFFRTGTSTVTTDLANANGYIGVGNQDASDTNSFAVLTIFDYANTNTHKLMQGYAYSYTGAGAHQVGFSMTAMTSGTAAVTEIDLFGSGNPTLTQGTYFLYGVK